MWAGSYPYVLQTKREDYLWLLDRMIAGQRSELIKHASTLELNSYFKKYNMLGVAMS